MVIDTGQVADVLVIGAGVAGLQASLDLATMGFPVVLLERSPVIGGTMARLERIFPARECSLCVLAPMMAQVRRHPGIRLLTMTRLDSLAGEAGCFTATMVTAPRYVDIGLCNGCGLCAQNCPVTALPDPVTGPRRAIYAPPPRLVPGAFLVDPGRCLHLATRTSARGGDSLCRVCAKVCPAQAVDFNQREEIVTRTVGAVVLATGFEPLDPRILPQYGYGRLPGVLAGLELEHLIDEAAGGEDAVLRRPGDRRPVRRVAWIQCVGSRNVKIGAGYCSAICCMNTAKEATLVRERWPQVECVVFGTDFRVWGPDLPRSFETALGAGVRYERCWVGEVTGERGDLRLRYCRSDGRVAEERFDLVVLAAGLRPSRDTMQLAGRCGLDLNRWGFCGTGGPDGTASGRAGIYLAGGCRGPQDITTSVIDGSTAAGRVAVSLAGVRPPATGRADTVPERDVHLEQARVGVFICRCGFNIAQVVDVTAVARQAGTLPGVVRVEECRYACSDEGQSLIRQAIGEDGLNRVVVAACTPRLHEALFADVLRAAGLNPALLEMANLREQCSWVHRRDRPGATAKAAALVRRAVARAALLQPVAAVSVQVQPAALVVGGGAAGLAAACDLADCGMAVHLVEKTDRLGGRVLEPGACLGDPGGREFVAELAARAQNHPGVRIYRESVLTTVAGRPGDFTSRLATGGGGEKEIRYGAAVIAVGARAAQPAEPLYPTHPRVVTVTELDRALARDEDLLAGTSTFAYILCAGSSDETVPYCSMVCCGQALDSALALAARHKARILVLYRNLRAGSFREEIYRRARRAGVIFIPYTDAPRLEASGEGLRLFVREPVVDAGLVWEPDVVALAPPLLPPADAPAIARLFRVPLNQDGFFQEVHGKLLPVDLPVDGVFVAGAAGGPKFATESIGQGRAAAARAMRLLSGTTWETNHAVPRVREGQCAGCRVCVTVCPCGAVTIDADRQVAMVEESLCKGCGLCAAACPSGACTLANEGHVMAEIEALCGLGPVDAGGGEFA